MQCEHIYEMMSEKLDGRLDDDQLARLTEHVTACGACLAEWEKMQALDHLLSSAPMIEAPVRVRVRVMTSLERREQIQRAFIGGTTLTLGTVALGLVLIVPALFGLLNTTGIAPALIYGGPKTLSHLFSAGTTMGQTYATLFTELAIPLAMLGLCGLAMALLLNGVWIGALRRHAQR